MTLDAPSVGTAGPTDWLRTYPPPRSLSLDQEASRVFARAYHLGNEVEKPGEPPISFTTLVAALFEGDDSMSSWFASQAQTCGPKRQKVLNEKSIGTDVLARIAELREPPTEPRLSSDRNLLTSSARSVLQTAEGWAQRVRGNDIGVRHLVASLVLSPPANHRQQLQSWELNETLWRDRLFDWLQQNFTWEAWIETRQRIAPAQAAAAYDQQQVRAETLAWPGDADAQRVLAHAAALHARRTDRWLGLQTLVFALLDCVTSDPAIGNTLAPLKLMLEGIAPEYAKHRAGHPVVPANTSPPVGREFEKLDISPRVLNTLETARELATASAAQRGATEALTVGVVHLLGALVSPRVDSEVDLRRLGFDPSKLRDELVRFVVSRGEAENTWREMLGTDGESGFSPRPVELNSDEPEAVIRLDENWATDPLDIRTDVEAFAALLASNKLEPPLSIGLFGPWGSGKTTFLKRLRRAVDRRIKEQPPDGQARVFVANVVHVEFNAWHFAEEAIVSSLVETVFRELNRFIKDEQIVVGKAWKDQKSGVLETTRRRVDAAQAVYSAATRATADAATKLDTARNTVATKTAGLRTALGTVWTTTSAALADNQVVKDSGILKSIGESVRSMEEVKTKLAVIRSRPLRMLNDLGVPGTMLFAALLLGLPVAVAWGVGKFFESAGVTQALSALTAAASVVATWASKAASVVSKVELATVQVAEEFEKRLEEDSTVAAARQALTTAEDGELSAKAVLEGARTELSKAEAELAQASLPAQMLRLVGDRVAALDYSRELTSLSLARADLERLSRLLRETKGEASAPGARTVDRVILYIDDLDRCKPEEVVRVLQLVHMMLAFELFTVVVAVDARWVTQSLQDQYSWLATKGGSELGGQLTSGDYLEKIFQLAFWLEPMTTHRAARYLTSLVRAGSRESASGAADANLEALELDYLRVLSAYVGPSPRRVKRLVNTYRMMKARLSPAQLAGFLTDRQDENGGVRSGPYQIVIALLVVGTGATSEGPRILRELAEWDPRGTLDELMTALRTTSDPARPKHPDRMLAARVLETLVRTQQAKNVAELRGWAGRVERYLLQRADQGKALRN